MRRPFAKMSSAPGHKAQRVHQLRMALRVALLNLPESVVIDILSDNWLSLRRLDQLKERFP